MSVPIETQRLQHIYDAVEYLLDLVDPSDALYIAPIPQKFFVGEPDPDEESLYDHILESLEAMHTHIEGGNPVPRIKGDTPNWFDVASCFYWALGGENCNGDEDSVNYLIDKYNSYFEEADDE